MNNKIAGRHCFTHLSMILAFCLLAALTLPASAAGIPAGPLDQPPGGATITSQDPSGRQIGLSGGNTYTVTNLNPTQYGKLYWGIILPDAVKYSSDGAADSPGETLSLFSTVYDGTTSKAYWSGSTTLWYYGYYGVTQETDYSRMTLTVSDLNGKPLMFLSPNEVGLTGSGVLVEVTGPFKYTLQMEVAPSGSSTMYPALEYFNNAHTDPGMDGRVLTSITAGYYYTDVAIGGLAASNDGPTQLGSPTTFTASVTSGTHVSYGWNFGDGQTGVGASVAHTYTARGSYTATVTATNNAGQQTAQTTVNVIDAPVAGLAAISDGPTRLGSPTHFSASVTSGTNVVYAWDMGDGKQLSGKDVTHAYAETGLYTATVTASNQANTLSAETQVSVYVDDLALTMFTPAPNSHNAALDAPVDAVFNHRVDPATVTQKTFRVFSGYSGTLGGAFSFPTVGEAVFTPSNLYKPGERVDVTLSAGILHPSGAPLAPVVKQFRAKAPGGSGLFTNSGQSLGSAAAQALRLGDLNGDGSLDAVVINSPEDSQVWINDGLGKFTGGQSLAISEAINAALGDLDNDGDLDLYITRAGLPDQVWFNNGSGSFTLSSQALSTADSQSVQLGDLDADGDLDAFIVTSGDPSGPNQPDEVWFNDGTGIFTNSGQSLGSEVGMSAALGDLNGDGALDVYVANCEGGPDRLWLNNGKGIFTASAQALDGYCSADVDLGDVDGDGDLDVAVANGLFTAEPNQLYLNDGTGSLTNSGQNFDIDAQTIGLELADVNGDGALDLVFDLMGKNGEVWLNDGAGHFSITGQPLGDGASSGLALGDLDADGDLDAFLAGLNSQVWLNGNGAGVTISALSPSYKFINDAGFTLTVIGTSFMPGSQIHWGSETLPTTYVSTTRLTAQITAPHLANLGAVNLRVTNPDHTASNLQPFTIHPPAEWFLIGLASDTLTALTDHPTNGDILYAGASSGKVYQSTDGGSNWAEQSSGLAAQPVTALAINPQAPLVMYAAQNGGGVFKTINGGEAWAAINSGLGGLEARALVIDPQQPSTLYVGIYGSGVYKTTNGGESWQQTGSLTSNQVVALALDPQLPGTLYAGTRDHWLLKTADGGATWTGKNLFEVFSLGVSPLVSATVLAGSADGLQVSQDAGSSWSKAADGMVYALAFDPADPETFLIGTQDGQMARSPDGGKTWMPFNTGLNASLGLNALLAHSNSPAILYTATSHGMYTMKLPSPLSFLASLTPSLKVTGTPGFTLSIGGKQFAEGAVAMWGTTPLQTRWISSTQLEADVPADLLAAPGPVSLTVVYPSIPGSGVSNALTFTVREPYPTPAITALDTNSAVKGAPAFTLTITGSGFVPESIARWGETALATHYTSATTLTADVPASLVDKAGAVDITVLNPVPVGGASNALAFMVYNPAPGLVSLNPPSRRAGSPGLTLVVLGSGFVDGATVEWNGKALTTTFISDTELTASIPATSLLAPGKVTVTARNPLSTGPSNSLPFTIDPWAFLLPLLFR